jgi:hypothetical protein
LGSNSRSNCNCFGASSFAKVAMPVRFPPGRLRLATRPNATGSPPVPKTIGMVAVAAFAASVVPGPSAAFSGRVRAWSLELRDAVWDGADSERQPCSGYVGPGGAGMLPRAVFPSGQSVGSWWRARSLPPVGRSRADRVRRHRISPLHQAARTRHLFIRQQTAVINSIHAYLAEFGIVAPVGRSQSGRCRSPFRPAPGRVPWR